MAENNEERTYWQRAESLNGRAAMFGFVVGIATEAITGTGILGQVASIFRGFGG